MPDNNVGELAAALAKAQAAFPKVVKDRVAKIKTSSGQYEYAYADLASILEAVRRPLADNGLAIIQRMGIYDNVDGSSYAGLLLVTEVLHTSGARISSTYPLTKHDRPQETGSEITYARRYALSALLGIASEEDDDGAAAQNASPARRGAPRTQPERETPAEIPPTAPGPFADLSAALAYFEGGGRTCPDCQKDTIRKGNKSYGGGWFCSKRDGGCGGQWKEVKTTMPREANSAQADAPLVDVIGEAMAESATLEAEERGALIRELSRLGIVLNMSAADKRAVAMEHCGTPTPDLWTCDLAGLSGMVAALRKLEASKTQREAKK